MIYKIAQNRVSRTYKGGRRIEKFTNEIFDTSKYYPEDWTGSVICASNEGYGKTVDGKYIKDIVDDKKLPILVKLLDSDERLVIQVHPTVEFAKKYLNSDYGKTECWYFLECDENAYVYLGFKPNVTKEMWIDAIKKQDVEKLKEYLHKLPVKSDDFVFVDGGVPHAIGEGCFMIELQEPTDHMIVAEKITPSGRELPKHRLTMGLDEDIAFNMYDYTTYDEETLRNKYVKKTSEVKNKSVTILDDAMTDKFTMELMSGNCSYNLKRKYAVAIVVNGEGIFCDTNVKKGDRLFIEDESHLTLSGNNIKVVVCS